MIPLNEATAQLLCKLSIFLDHFTKVQPHLKKCHNSLLVEHSYIEDEWGLNDLSRLWDAKIHW